MEVKIIKTGCCKSQGVISRVLSFAKLLVLCSVLMVMGITQADLVYLALSATETTETLLGTITIPTVGVRRIVGVYGILMQPTATAGETVSGFFRLSFSSVAGKFKFPCTMMFGPAGTLASNATVAAAQIIPVDIPVPANETVSCYMSANKAMTGTGEGVVGLIME